jgi:DNA processing protein
MSGVAKEGTIAVMASGIDVCYPKQNSSLKGQIEENGVVVTEYAFGATPIAQRFPQRNRIIAALGHAVIVIEASLKSGSLITAQYAHKYSKTLFAVPGSPLDARYGGCNALIKEGKARLLTTPQEVIDYLCNFNFAYNVNDGHSNIFSSSTLLPSEGVLLKYRESVRDAISFAPTSMEQIMLTTKVDYSTLNVLILEMELCGLVQRLYGNVIVRLPI